MPVRAIRTSRRAACALLATSMAGCLGSTDTGTSSLTYAGFIGGPAFARLTETVESTDLALDAHVSGTVAVRGGPSGTMGGNYTASIRSMTLSGPGFTLTGGVTSGTYHPNSGVDGSYGFVRAQIDSLHWLCGSYNDRQTVGEIGVVIDPVTHNALIMAVTGGAAGFTGGTVVGDSLLATQWRGKFFNDTLVSGALKDSDGHIVGAFNVTPSKCGV